MLTHLRVSGFALLEEVEFDLEKGLTFLTGETGAGKSILIDAICRLLGSRATQDDVRAGTTKAVLEAGFDRLPAPAGELLKEWAIDAVEESLILRREIHASGKNKTLINNCAVTLQQVRRLAPLLIDLFGQNEHQSLLDTESQCAVYDGCLRNEALVSELSQTATEIARLQTEWKDLREKEHQRQRNIDLLKYQIQEIESAGISETEEVELSAKKILLQNREKIYAICESLLQTLLEQDGSLNALVRDSQKKLFELSKYQSEMNGFAKRLDEWQNDLRDLVRNIDVLRGSMDFQEGALDEIESRLEILHRLKRKYGPDLSDVLCHLNKCRLELDACLHGEEREESLVELTRRAVQRYAQRAAEVTRAREQAKDRFAMRVEEELRQVAMERCRFRVQLSGGPCSSIEDLDTESLMRLNCPPAGWESVKFEIEPNTGEGFRDLSRIASGGELSRLMLALKVVSQSQEEGRTLIFDEIDAGIGGRVATHVGERLKRLSRESQVLCVTHLPQVAAFGDHHLQVEKIDKDNRTITVVRTLDEPMRVRELARMLSGSEITDTALQHARELRERVEAGVR